MQIKKKALVLIITYLFLGQTLLAKTVVIHHPTTKPTTEKKEETVSKNKNTEEKPTEVKLNKTKENVKKNNGTQKKSSTTATEKIQKNKSMTYATNKPIPQDTPKQISKNLPHYFKDWMKYLRKYEKCGKNCTLTYGEILKLIEDENITGQQAAVLAAIITQINDAKLTNTKF